MTEKMLSIHYRYFFNVPLPWTLSCQVIFVKIMSESFFLSFTSEGQLISMK